MGKKRLILVRHGIRGFPEPIPPVSPNPECLLLLASQENLSLHGHLYCYKLGEYIKEKYGKPGFVYADITTPRTVDSAISMSQATGNNEIHLAAQDPDLFFQFPKTITPETIQAANEIVEHHQKQLFEIKDACEKEQPCLKLAEKTEINPETAAITGLALQEYVLGSEMLFAELSKIKSPLLKKREEIMQIHPIYWMLKGPTRETIKAPAKVMLAGISYFLEKYDFSVLVGHEHNIIQISQYLGKLFEVPGFSTLWVPPNSGFIFTLKPDGLKVKILYLNREGKFKVIKYALITRPIPKFEIELIGRTVGY